MVDIDVYAKKLKDLARKLRKAGNLSEVLLWEKLKKKQLCGLDFNRQRPIGNYIVDFYCKERKVAIEIDGYSHNCKVEYDRKRDEYLKGLGVEVIHIDDTDVKQNMDGVIYMLERHEMLQPR